MIYLQRLAALAAASGVVMALSGCFGGGGDDPIAGTTIQTLNNRADLVSGGSALAQVTLPAGADLTQLQVSLNGTDITSTFSK